MGKTNYILEVDADANLIAWFVLAGSLLFLVRPWTARRLLAVLAALASYGILASITLSLVDLPATALIFGGLTLGAWYSWAMFAAAALTRETSVLALAGAFDPQVLRRPREWGRAAAQLLIVVGPLALWMLYVGHRFGDGGSPSGSGNFSWPLVAVSSRLVQAIRTGFAAATGELVVIQDADREYDPREYPLLMAPFLTGHADVVYGSRFTGGQAHRVVYFWHMVGNRFLTLLSNMFSNPNLTDMETGFKMFRRKAIQGIKIEEDRFGFEPEITAKPARRGAVFYEVGISYHGRTYEGGKKIHWQDGFRAIYAIFRYNLFPH